mmetsp:Transcript_86438/g.175724  ORF Transcript_86438/g.175724 Transcript_86438/m.175724 type:complete len:108 (+) Transcript_86438:351-674(+)
MPSQDTSTTSSCNGRIAGGLRSNGRPPQQQRQHQQQQQQQQQQYRRQRWQRHAPQLFFCFRDQATGALSPSSSSTTLELVIEALDVLGSEDEDGSEDKTNYNHDNRS